MSQTNLDANQVIKSVFDEVSGTLKTTPGNPIGTATEVAISSVDDSMAIGDPAGNLVSVIDNALSVLPANSMVPEHDEVLITYTDATKEVISTVVFKLASSTVATLTYSEPSGTQERWLRS